MILGVNLRTCEAAKYKPTKSKGWV